jgi:hypothetical protein
MCNALIEGITYTEQGYTAEIEYRCIPCQYSYEYSYGGNRVLIGNMEFIWSYNDPKPTNERHADAVAACLWH